GVPVAGATDPDYSPSNLNDGDEVSLVVTSSLTCSSNSPDTSAVITTNIISSSPPQVQISASVASICDGDAITINSTVLNGGTSPDLQWLLNGIPVPGATIDSLILNSPSDGDLVTLRVISSIPCANPDTVISTAITVNVIPIDTFNISLASISGICTKQIVQFSGGVTPFPPPGSYFTWYLNGDSVAASANYFVSGDVLQDGDTISFGLVASGGCFIDLTVFSPNFIVDVKEGSVIDAGTNREIAYADTAVLFPFVTAGEVNGSWFWYPDTFINITNFKNPTVLPLVDTWYTAVFTNSFGCRSIDSVFIDVKPNYEVFVPSAFSPNEDGRNDVLYVRGPFIATCNLSIFNRWGQKVFESPYPVYGWDGLSNYKECDSGVYTWYAEGTFIDGTPFSKFGNVTIFR
ncbi:MAG: hypothetical protein RLZZ46_86, partial [Bacteroidota bacterium]